MVRSLRGVIILTILSVMVSIFNPAHAAQRKPKAGAADPTLSIQGKQKKKLSKINRKTNRKKRSKGA